MAGALSSIPDSGGYSMQPAVDYGGALSSGPAPSYMPGVSPQILSMMNNVPPGPESPYARQLYDTSKAVIGDPDEAAGALQSSRNNYDQAVQAKMSAIQRAMQRLSVPQGQTNLPLMAGAIGALQPTRTGSIGETIGNAFGAALPQIEKQREIERQLQAALGQGDIDQANTQMQGAQGDETFLDKRFDLANKMENEAGTIQNRADLNTYRTRQGVMQYAGRIGAAEIGANKNRWQYLGQDPNDPTVGQYLDKNAPTRTVVAGPAIAPKTSANVPVAQWRYNAWLAVHPNDSAGALDYSAGHKTMTAEQQRASAMSLAQKELGTGSDPEDINARAQQIYDTVRGGFDGEAAAPAAAAASAAPAQAPAQGRPASAAASIPARPQGVPLQGQYSPSQGKWWWKDAAGHWTHS